MSDLLTITDVAKLAGLTRESVRRYAVNYDDGKGGLKTTFVCGRRLVERAEAERFAAAERPKPGRRWPPKTKKKPRKH